MDEIKETTVEKSDLDIAKENGYVVTGILEIVEDGYGFLRSENYLTGTNDVYVSASQIRRFNLRTGDFVTGYTREPKQGERFKALVYLTAVNDQNPEVVKRRTRFEDLTPCYPEERIILDNCGVSLRIIDLMSPIGKGQRGLIVSPPKAGKTTLLKEMSVTIKKNNPDVHIIVLLIDERPEEVTDFKETTEEYGIEVIYSTFDERAERHRKVAEMTIERARRLAECNEDVVILLDSITRLTRASNMLVTPSGRTLSGGIDPAALYMPKHFFGAARNTREAGSLTIIATALTDTGSRMDDVIYEEFKGTGNMEVVLNRELQEKRLFPAIDLLKTGTRREELLLNEDEMKVVSLIRNSLNDFRKDQAIERLLNLFSGTKNNRELIGLLLKENK